MAGEAIGNSDRIRSVHNSFTAPHAILPDKHDDDGSGEAFHFVAYVHRNGGVWELDGLQPGPIRLGDADQVGGGAVGTVDAR